MQVTHEAAAVVVDFFSRSTSANQRDIRLQSHDFAFDVVHAAKGENLMTVEANQVGQSASLRVDLFQGQWCFHSSGCCGGTEVALVVKRAVNTGNDLEGKGTELVVLSTTYGNQMFFRYAVGPHHIFCALRADHRGTSFEGDMRNIQDVVIVGMSDENEICSLNVGVDYRYVRGRNVTPPISPASVVSHGMAPCGAGPLIRDRYGSIKIEVVPSEISQPAAPRYFRMTGLLFPALGWF